MRLVAVLLVALLALPGAAAAPPAPEFPDEIVALSGRWIEEQEALLTAEDRAAPWFAEADEFLQRAKAAHADGRFRQATFHLETFHELLTTQRLMDEARAQFTTDGDRRVYTLQRLAALRGDADRGWEAYRAKLHGYDDEMRSLRTVELAVYSADSALSAMLGAQAFEPLSREFQQRPDFPESYVLSLARASATALLAIGWADDVLDEATRTEGLPPQILDEAWRNITDTALASGHDRTPVDLEAYETLGDPVRANGERTMALAIYLAMLRQGRVSEMSTIFGDASRREDDIVNLTKGYMERALANATLDVPRDYGLLGIFTSDAIDRASLTVEYLEDGTGGVDFVYSAWSALDHANYANAILSRVSPTVPSPTPEKTPGPGIVAVLMIGAALAVAMRRR